MKRKINMLFLLLVLLLILGGCQKSPSASKDDNEANTGNEQTGSESNNGNNTVIDADFVQSPSEMFTDRDYKADYNENESIFIELNGSSATCSSKNVQISGSTITILDEGTYIISGTMENGMIVVNAEETDKPQLVLKDASIYSETSAPLYILKADKVFVTSAFGSNNSLSNGGTFTAIDDNHIDGAVFSKQDLTFNGSGNLTISSPSGHGIVCNDDLVFTDGNYTIQSSSHGIDANDSVRIVNASISIDAGKDGIHVENNDDTSLGYLYVSSGTLSVSAQGDGLSAVAFLQIEDGTFDIISGGGSANSSKEHSDSWGGFMGGGKNPFSSSQTDSKEDSTSMKALKVTGNMLINGGNFTIDAADDALHANISIFVNGGDFEIASGDDGLHADETLNITSGTVRITESYEGLEALDIVVLGGDIQLVATDDGLNAAGGTDSSGTTDGRDGMFGDMGGPGGGGPGGMGGSSNGSIIISGGNLYINASGDGIDANGTLEISGGYTVVCGPIQGDTATLDFDKSASITGGTFIGTGASGMAQTFSSSTQGVYAVKVGNQAAGATITLTDSSGNTIISYEPELPFAVVILSSPRIVKGEIYTITIGNTTGEFEAK